MYALVTNRLYHITTESIKLIEMLQGDTEMMDVRPSGEVGIGVPFYLDWKFL